MMQKNTRKSESETDDLIINDLGVNKDQKKKSKDVLLLKKFNVKFFAIIVLIVLVIATLIFAIRFVSFNSMVLVWKTSLTKGSSEVNNKSIEYMSFRNGLMRISNDGATYIDDTGNVNWTVAYNLKDPIYVANEGYFSIADRNGNNFYIFDKTGLVGENTTSNPIIKIATSTEGVLYVMQSDDNNSYINVFRANGTPIDLSIKTNLTEDGMPTDISTSNSGEELVTSYICLADDKIFTKATYYNFGDAGRGSNSKRIVGEFVDEFDDKFLARVHFFDDEKSCLVYDGGIYFVSTADPARPRIIDKKESIDSMSSISYTNKYFGVIAEDGRLMIFDDSGSTLCDKKIDFSYNKFYLNDDYAIFLDGKTIRILDTRGRMIFDKEMTSTVEYVAKKKSLVFTELLVGLIDGVECIRFY